MLVHLHWWPPDIEFDSKDLQTVLAVLEEQNRKAKQRGRSR